MENVIRSIDPESPLKGKAVAGDRLLSIRRLCSELGLEIFCFSIYLNSLNRSDRPATDDEYVEAYAKIEAEMTSEIEKIVAKVGAEDYD